MRVNIPVSHKISKMASDESDNYNYSDDEIDDRKHEKIVQSVLSLNKVQHLKKPSRTEPTLHISEFDLVKSVTGNKGSVHINELTKVLKGRKSHEVIKSKITSTSKKAATLPKPLEKPQAEKIRRGVAYEKNRLEFDRWEAFVTSNRAASHVSFPLDITDSLKIEEKHADKFPSKWRIKFDLQKKLEALEKVEEYHIETEKDSFPLTMKEVMEQRKEAAKLRAHQSYKEAKARRQNKIKSKKYHRIQRREKIKQQLKEFEQLQKTNPEEALKKLEDIERARAEERFSLRHKGTGQWAKNKQIRAKYDKESRQVLAQQLAISRDLTQKIKETGSDSEDEGIASEENPQDLPKDGDNPWVNGMKPDAEVVDFLSGYRKYWSEQNKLKDEDNEPVVEDTENIDAEMEEFKANLKLQQEKPRSKKNIENADVNTQQKNTTQKKRKSKTNTKVEIKKKTKTKKQDLNVSQSTSDWDVTQVGTESIEEMFDKLEDRMELKVKERIKKVKSNNTGVQQTKTKKANKVKKKKIDLTMKSQSKRHFIDEELNEVTGDQEENTDEVNELRTILNSAVDEVPAATSDIDPNKFMNVKSTNLKTAIPDIQTMGDEEENDNQRDIIMEAFEDDDIVEDFQKEKADEVEKDKPKNIDLSLPGWGSWGGTGIVPSKRKKKRFMLKMPAKVPRKDDNKGTLIINEKAQEKIKEHMVSDVPFPFKTVKDFEASIRAPIGNTFVPETAYRRLIEPAVKTKLGAIIEPMTREVLVGVRRK